MGVLNQFLFIGLLLAGGVALNFFMLITRHMSAPELDCNEYWGAGNVSNYRPIQLIRPANITIPIEIINDLKEQLKRPLRLHEPLEGANFEYGFNTKYLQEIVDYWQNTYLPNWNVRQDYLLKFQHFETEIQGLKIHFIHAKPQITVSKTVLPLLLLHGWPGSVREFYELISLLTTPKPNVQYAFEVIAPSLPGYAWSEATKRKGLGPVQMAVMLRNLMLRLNHEQFLIQGGDWGAIIGSYIAAMYPQNVIGFHSNMCVNSSPLSMLKSVIARIFPDYYYEVQYAQFFKPLSEVFSRILTETGYMHLQATKPDTIGTALSNNPVGLAAYILEKFSAWTNKDYKYLRNGGLTDKFKLDDLLDNIMIYYATNSITTSQRIYAEHFSKTQMNFQMDRIPIEVPTGCVRFLHDLIHSTDSQLKDRFTNLIHSTYYSNGGHFAAMEVPLVLYIDFIKFIDKLNSL